MVGPQCLAYPDVSILSGHLMVTARIPLLRHKEAIEENTFYFGGKATEM